VRLEVEENMRGRRGDDRQEKQNIRERRRTGYNVASKIGNKKRMKDR
jgi:hypothetical protein